MAIYNPSDLYGGGAFRIDTTPMLNFLVKRQAQEQAKEQALDKYFSDMLKTASDKNVRPQEIPAFQASIKNAKNFYIQNKDAIVSGKNPDVRMQYEQIASIPNMIIADSSKALATDVRIGNAQIANPKLKDRWTRKTLDKYNASVQSAWEVDPITGQPVKNSNWEEFNPAMIEVNPEEMDVNQYISKQFNQFGIKPSQRIIGKELIPGSTFVYKGTKEIYYNPESLKDFGDVMKSSYNNDNTLQYNFAKGQTLAQMKSGDAKGFEELNNIYKNIYGTDIQEDEDLFAATAIKNVGQTSTEPYKEVDEAAQMKERARISRENSAALAKAVKEAKSKGVDVDTNTIPTALDRFATGTAKARGTNTPLTIGGNKWTDQSGKPFTGEVVLDKNKVPVEIIKAIPQSQFTTEFLIQVKNGVPVNVSTDEGSVDRDALLEGEINKKIKEKRLKSTSFVPSTSGSVGQDLTTNENNDKLNLSI